MPVQLARRHITTAEYHKMIETGVFHEDERLELIDGELFEMSPIGPRHVNDRVEIYSQPNNDVYQAIRIVLRGQNVVSKTIPQIVLKADEILGYEKG